MQTTYKIDPAHSSVQFSVRHMMITNVRGSFSGVQGVITYNPEQPAESHIRAEIDAQSISTNDAQRDAHLKTADFLDVGNYPKFIFQSKKFEPNGNDELSIVGDLTLHGVTKEVVLKAEGPTEERTDPFGNTRVGASATTKIKRSDFGLTWNAALETGGILVGDDLKIELDISAIKE